jgi:hypothetical protein
MLAQRLISKTVARPFIQLETSKAAVHVYVHLHEIMNSQISQRWLILE